MFYVANLLFMIQSKLQGGWSTFVPCYHTMVVKGDINKALYARSLFRTIVRMVLLTTLHLASIGTTLNICDNRSALSNDILKSTSLLTKIFFISGRNMATFAVADFVSKNTKHLRYWLAALAPNVTLQDLQVIMYFPFSSMVCNLELLQRLFGQERKGSTSNTPVIMPLSNCSVSVKSSSESVPFSSEIFSRSESWSTTCNEIDFSLNTLKKWLFFFVYYFYVD